MGFAQINSTMANEPVSDARVLGPVVKSAGRALQILEFFDTVQREACVSEISRALAYPQSSTSVLLRSLVTMGYLLHDRSARSYYPTRRVSLLGSWVDPSLIQQGQLLEFVEELSRRSEQRVVMATANGLFAQYIYVSRDQDLQGSAPPVAIGALRSLAQTAVGMALLATFDEPRAAGTLRRINAERSEDEPPIPVCEIMEQLAEGRKRGYFSGGGASERDAGIAVIASRERQLLVLGMEGNADEIARCESRLVERLTGTAFAMKAHDLA